MSMKASRYAYEAHRNALCGATGEGAMCTTKCQLELSPWLGFWVRASSSSQPFPLVVAGFLILVSNCTSHFYHKTTAVRWHLEERK